MFHSSWYGIGWWISLFVVETETAFSGYDSHLTVLFILVLLFVLHLFYRFSTSSNVWILCFWGTNNFICYSFAMSEASDSWLAMMDRLLILGDSSNSEKTHVKANMLRLVDLYYEALDAPKKGGKVSSVFCCFSCVIGCINRDLVLLFTFFRYVVIISGRTYCMQLNIWCFV